MNHRCSDLHKPNAYSHLSGDESHQSITRIPVPPASTREYVLDTFGKSAGTS